MLSIFPYLITSIILIFQDKVYRKVDAYIVFINLGLLYLATIKYNGLFLLLPILLMVFGYHVRFSKNKKYPKLVDVVYFIVTLYLLYLVRYYQVPLKIILAALFLMVVLFCIFTVIKKEEFIPYLTIVIPAHMLLLLSLMIYGS